MKKAAMLLIFLFLTGMFAGLFFSTNLSAESSDSLSPLLIASLTSSDIGFCKSFILSLTSNFALCLIMLPAAFSRYLSPLPAAILLYKGFAIGFCSGLLYLGAGSRAFLLSALKIVPQNLFILPALFILALALSSSRGAHKKSGPTLRGDLLPPFLLSALLLILGSLTEAALHLIAL